MLWLTKSDIYETIEKVINDIFTCLVFGLSSLFFLNKSFVISRPGKSSLLLSKNLDMWNFFVILGSFLSVRYQSQLTKVYLLKKVAGEFLPLYVHIFF